MIRILNQVDRVVGFALRGVAVLMFVVLFVILTGNVFFRWFPLMSMGWFDEIVQLCFGYMVFIGAAAIWRDRNHFKIDWIENKLRGKPLGQIVMVFVDLVSLLFFLYLAYFGWELVMRTTDVTPIFQFSRRILYACIPISGVIMAAYAVRDVIVHARGAAEAIEE